MSLEEKFGSQPTLSRLENSADRGTINSCYQANLELLDQAWQRDDIKTMTLDLDASESECHGKQAGARYHGYHQEVMYNPLYLHRAETKDCLKAILRHGSCPDYHKAVPFLEEPIDFLIARGYRPKLRADAGFNCPELYGYLESKEGVEYTIRLKTNNRLAQKALELLPFTRKELEKDGAEKFKDKYAAFDYQADSWGRPRRVHVKRTYNPNQLFPEYYFVLSNIQRETGETDETLAMRIFKFYNQRGASENYHKEGKLDLFFTRLSCSEFWANAFRLQVAVLAYNVNNIFRRFVLPEELKPNLLSTLRWKIINIGCRIIKHAREIICKFGNNFKQKKLIKWIIERLQLFKLCWD